MNSAGGRCHDNARCESMWARMKTELLYDRYDSERLTVEHLKSLVWRYFMSYWNNRRICSANGGLPPMVKRNRFYARRRVRQNKKSKGRFYAFAPQKAGYPFVSAECSSMRQPSMSTSFSRMKGWAVSCPHSVSYFNMR